MWAAHESVPGPFFRNGRSSRWLFYKQAYFMELFELSVDVVHIRGGFLLNSFLMLNTNDFVFTCHGADSWTVTGTLGPCDLEQALSGDTWCMKNWVTEFSVATSSVLYCKSPILLTSSCHSFMKTLYYARIIADYQRQKEEWNACMWTRPKNLQFFLKTIGNCF